MDYLFFDWLQGEWKSSYSIALREALNGLRSIGAALPPSKKCDETCTDYMVLKVQEHGLTPSSVEIGKSITLTGDKLK